MTRANREIDATSEEPVVLADGLRLYLRPVQPTDRHHLSLGLERLSSESRYMRFMGARDGLSDAMLRYLTEVDGTSHFALGAVVRTSDGTEEGVGVARFIRLEEDPAVAELAVTVLDDYQGQGLGRILVDRLVAAGRQRGVERFRCEFFSHNDKVRRLLAPYEKGASIRDDGRVVIMEFTLPHPSLADRMSGALRGSSMYRALRKATDGLFPAPPAGHGSTRGGEGSGSADLVGQ